MYNCKVVSFWETLKIECVLLRKFQISFWTKPVSFSWKFYRLYLYLPIVVFEINPQLKSVHFKNTVARSSVHSKIWSFSTIHQIFFWFSWCIIENERNFECNKQPPAGTHFISGLKSQTLKLPFLAWK